MFTITSRSTSKSMKKTINLIALVMALLTGISLYAQKTSKPIVTIKNTSLLPQQGNHAVAGYSEAFNRRYQENAENIASLLSTEQVMVKTQGSGGATNFILEFKAFLIRDCDPCEGDEAFASESFSVYVKVIDPGSMRTIIDKEIEANYTVTGSPEIGEMVDRTWTDFIGQLFSGEELADMLKQQTKIIDAAITFRPKSESDEVPMKADGEKRGWVKIVAIATEKDNTPLGENPDNNLTEFELRCQNGLLIDKDGSQVKKLSFKGSDFDANPSLFEYEYVVYDCDKICDKIDVFTLDLTSQNGTDLKQNITEKAEEFACYGYTLTLEYHIEGQMFGTADINARWDCFKIGFRRDEEPVLYNGDTDNRGRPVDVLMNPLMPPFRYLPAYGDKVYVASGQLPGRPSESSFSLSGGPYAEVAGSFYLDYDHLHENPMLLVVEQTTPMLGYDQPIERGVYLNWQFDVWAAIDGDILQMFAPASELLYSDMESEVESSPLAAYEWNESRVPDEVVEKMKKGESFSFTITNFAGASCIISGSIE